MFVLSRPLPGLYRVALLRYNKQTRETYPAMLEEILMTQALSAEEKARLKKQWTELAVKQAQEGQWEEAVNIALGVWLVVSPWALRFSDQANVRLNAVIVGLLVMALAIWAMVLDPDFERWRHHKAAS